MSRTLPVTCPGLPGRMTRPSLYQRMLKGGSPSSTTHETWTRELTSETGGIANGVILGPAFKQNGQTDKEKKKMGNFVLYLFISYRSNVRQ